MTNIIINFVDTNSNIRMPESNVFLGDCMDFLHQQADNSFDLAIVDPPYGMANSNARQAHEGRFGGRFCRYIEENVKQGIKTDNTRRSEMPTWDIAPPTEYFTELRRVSRNQVIWGANYFTMPPTRCFLVWNKMQPEKFSMAMCEYAWTSFSGNAKIFTMKAQRGEHSGKFHPTEKPIELYCWILRLFANKGDRILDTHMGSQSSRIAAYLMGYDFAGCEIDPWYFQKGEERFQRECHGVRVQKNGRKIITQTLDI